MKEKLEAMKGEIEKTIVAYNEGLKAIDNQDSEDYRQLNDQMTNLKNYLGYVTAEIVLQTD